MKKQVWQIGEESEEWQEEVKFINENYEFMHEINEKDKSGEYIYKPSWFFKTISDSMGWLQKGNDISVEDALKMVLWGAVTMVLLTIAGVIYAI